MSKKVIAILPWQSNLMGQNMYSYVKSESKDGLGKFKTTLHVNCNNNFKWEKNNMVFGKFTKLFGYEKLPCY